MDDHQQPPGPSIPLSPGTSSALVVRLLDERRQLYEHSQNPLDLWGAYSLCRDVKCPIPEWVLESFDTIHRQLTKIYTDEILALSYDQAGVDGPERPPWKAATLEAFGFRAPDVRGGPQNPFRKACRALWSESLATRVRVLVDGEGLTVSKACLVVAVARGEDEPTVRRAWIEFEPVVRMRDLTAQQTEIAWYDRFRSINPND
jgi:hypothetical protein